MSSSDKELDTLENIIEKVLEELEESDTPQEVESEKKEFKPPQIHIEVVMNGSDVPELAKVLEDSSKELVNSLKKTSDEFVASDAFKNLNQAFSHLDKTTKQFFTQIEDMMKNSSTDPTDNPMIQEEQPTQDKQDEEVDDNNQDEEHENEDSSDEEDDGDEESSDEEHDDEDEDDDQEQEDKDSSDEEVEDDEVEVDYEDYVYLIYKNKELIGYTTGFKRAVSTMKRIFHQYLIENSATNHMIRINKKFWPDNDEDEEYGAIKIYRLSPYLWNVFNESLELAITIHRAHYIL